MHISPSLRQPRKHTKQRSDSYLLFIKVGIGGILLVLLYSKKRYPEETRGGGCFNPPPLGLRGLKKLKMRNLASVFLDRDSEILRIISDEKITQKHLQIE